MSADGSSNNVSESEEGAKISNVSEKHNPIDIQTTDVSSTSEVLSQPETKGDTISSNNVQTDETSDEVNVVVDDKGRRDELEMNTSIETGDKNNLTMTDLRAAVDELDENIDEAFGHAAQSIWRLATSVTGSVSSAVGETPSLGKLRENVTTHLKPLDALGHNLSSRLEGFTPADSVAKLAGSVKSVAQNVQRNAQEMERALLAKANGSERLDKATESAALFDDVGISVTPRSSTAAINVDAEDNSGQSKPEENGMRVEDEIARVGASLGKTVGGLWNGLWGSEQSGWELADGDGAPWSGTGSKPTTRFEKRVFELQADPNTYCEPAADLDGFEKWGQCFDLEKRADECIEILSTHEAIAELYERVVPDIVEEDIFWMRYFYAKHVLEMEEERRKKLLERTEIGGEHAEEDDGWGDDDWEDVDTNTKNDASDNVDTTVDENFESKNDNTIVELGFESEELEPASDNTRTDGNGNVEDGRDTSAVSGTTTKVADVESDTKKLIKKEIGAGAVGTDDDWGDDWE